MSCAQCRHENHPDASFCHECGYPLLHLWPQADRSPSPTPARGRPRRPPSRLIEVVGAIGIVVTGLSVISGIVVASPGWQRIIASWRESLAARSASVRPAIGTRTETTPPAAHNAAVRGESPAYPAVGAAEVVAVQPQGILPSVREVQPATGGPVPTRPARAPEPMRSAPVRAQSDSPQVMATLLVSQLGQDPAWRTALANADAHSPDSPEHAYWRSVATAIRDGGGLRSRP
jgi:hypothetical protein